MSQVRPGVLIAIVAFALFAAYAFFSPATYRATALVVVESAASAPLVNIPEPLEAGRRLVEGVLDRKTLAVLSRERASTTAPEAVASAASVVRNSLDIGTSDSRAFSISYRDTDKLRAQRVCNKIADRAAERAPKVFVDRAFEHALDAKRQVSVQELAAFLALHPQVAMETSPAGTPPVEKDSGVSALNAEKANLEHRLVELENGVGSDNPYQDPAYSDVSLLKRRAAEINTALAAHRDALSAEAPAPPLSSEQRAEWQRLLSEVTDSGAVAQASTQSIVARVVKHAPPPGAPIDPNRPLLLVFGLIFGSGFGAIFTLLSRAGQQRRAKSSRPPGLAKGSATLHLPVAPAVPTRLGPSVPMLGAAPRSPPIVPIEQRRITSNPPVPLPEESALLTNGAPQSGGSSNPPRRISARPFASTLVPSRSAHSSLGQDADRGSASWAPDERVPAHAVSDVAVKSGSEPPSLSASPSVPPQTVEAHAVSMPMPRTSGARSLPPNPMKVTQPLGSFLMDAGWSTPPNGTPQTREPELVMSPRSSSPSPVSRYSYTSSSPPPVPYDSAPTSGPPNEVQRPGPVVRVDEVPTGWKPDANLTPNARRALCEQLYQFAVDSCFVLLVVSVPESNSSKSRVAAELALELAASGHPRVLLLEGDFQRPCLQRLTNVEMPISKGFSQQLHARMHNREQSPWWTVMGCEKSLHVLAEGVMRSPGLLLSRQFADALRDFRTYYDFIVIDGPTSSQGIDSGALNAVVDGLITVSPTEGSAAVARVQALFGRKRFTAVVTVARA